MPIVQLGLLAQVAVEFDDDVTALLLFLLVLIRRTLASRSAKPVLVSWLSLGYFPRDMHIAEMFDFVGAPEEIRTPDPQIRSLGSGSVWGYRRSERDVELRQARRPANSPFRSSVPKR